jgi:hypothetical protein
MNTGFCGRLQWVPQTRFLCYEIYKHNFYNFNLKSPCIFDNHYLKHQLVDPVDILNSDNFYNFNSIFRCIRKIAKSD